MNVAFCTCRDTKCPLNPVNHDRGCTPCIGKCLREGELPSCFFNAVAPYRGPDADYTYQGFAQLVLEYRFTSIPYSSAASRRLMFSFTISKIRMIPPFLRKNGGLPDLGQAAVCVFSYDVLISSSFLASRKAFFRAPCRLICAAYRQASEQYLTLLRVVGNTLPQFSQVHSRLRLSAASCR